jgi:hypothetical protein
MTAEELADKIEKQIDPDGGGNWSYRSGNML